MKGKFIALYGINNLGKTYQAERLVKHLHNLGIAANYLKYPIYDSPSGKKINDYLRHNSREFGLTKDDAQIVYMQNRREFEPTLKHWLTDGISVVAEDYTLTGIAWGMAEGWDEKKLLELNKGLLKPDLEILMSVDNVADRFKQSIEPGHLNEANEAKIELSRQHHLTLAKQFYLPIINANQTKNKVADRIWQLVKPLFTH